MTVILEPGGPRSALLIEQAYAEEARECPDINEHHTPIRLLFPRSFVEAVDTMSGTKVYDYCFVGGLYRPETFDHRAWILDFAARRFTDRSYLLLTDREPAHERLGAFDRTHVDRDVFVPKEVPPAERARFHAHYFQVMRSSQFTLCPAGDRPWSQRFFEAIMCRSIPIVSDPDHVGRNELERQIGYHVYRCDDDHVYDEDLVEENRRLFLRHQTLIGA
ncbi:MAG: exostosin family protein [Acidimicrobiales bacterium]